MNGRALVLASLAGLVTAGAITRRGSRSQLTWSEERAARLAAPIPSTWYHLTDRAKFRLDPRFTPSDNALAIEDRSGRPGIYLGSDVERWVNGSGYWRPFVAEFHVDPSITEDPGVGGRWGGELFVPAASFGKLTLQRVIPLDAWAREHYGSHGWIEGALGREFDTGTPIVERGWDEPVKPPPFRGWRYPGPDVRDMPADEIRRLRAQLRKARPRGSRGTLPRPGKRASDAVMSRLGRARAREVLAEGGCDAWDPEYQEARFYHVAPVESLPAIRARGLRPDQREPGFVGFQEWSKGRVFLSAGEDARSYWERVMHDSTRRTWTSAEWVTLRIRAGSPAYTKVQHDWKAEHPCSFYVESTIPPKDLEIQDAAGTWVSLAGWTNPR